MADLVIRGRRVVTAESVRPAAVHVTGGVIDRVAGYDDAVAGLEAKLAAAAGRCHVDTAFWGGIASLQLALPLVWTGARARGHTLVELARWMAAAPARLAGLHGRKGAIVAGRAADLVVFDPDAAFRVDPASLHHRHPVTPYAGRMLHGVVLETWLRGRMVHDRGRLAPPTGMALPRETSAR
jgi:cytosine/adenosine deaminase-related metal-dependent hydrolase